MRAKSPETPHGFLLCQPMIGTARVIYFREMAKRKCNLANRQNVVAFVSADVGRGSERHVFFHLTVTYKKHVIGFL